MKRLFTPEEREEHLVEVYDLTCQLFDLMHELDARRKGQTAWDVVTDDMEGLAIYTMLDKALDAAREVLEGRDQPRVEA